MKKTIFVTLLAAMMLFAFVACENNPAPAGYQLGASNAVITAEESDANHYAMKTNTEAATVTVEANIITVSANDDDLKTCTSDDPDQDDAPYKWIGVLIDTKLDSIVGAKLSEASDYTFEEKDKTEAANVGGNDGEFVLWVKAEDAEGTKYPRPIKLYDEEGNFLTTFTVVLDIASSTSAEDGE